jgi:DNA-binding NtrC family response regulator
VEWGLHFSWWLAKSFQSQWCLVGLPDARNFLFERMESSMLRKPTLLLSEEHPVLSRQLRELLACRDYRIAESFNELLTLNFVRAKQIDLLLLIAPSEHPSYAIALCCRVRELDATVPIILIAKESSEELAINALRCGINDYFRWPLSQEELFASLSRYLAGAPESAANSAHDTDSRMVGGGSVEQIRHCISRLAAVGSNVLVTGETGTGKELVAELIHHDSPRAKRPLVCVNCAAIPDTLLESEFFGYEKGAFTGAQTAKHGKLRMADGGTVFFDEIGDMTPYAQAKILRTIESKEIQPLGGRGSIAVDFRVIAATNHDLERLSAEGKFRQDLYFRLNVGRIHLPPLRERKEDIPVLIQHYIAEFNRIFNRRVDRFSDEALAYLIAYDWPGNIRELRNTLEAAFVNLSPGAGSVIDLPELFRKRIQAAPAATLSERDHLLSTLLATNWNKSKTAERLNWSRMTVYRKLAKYRLALNPSKRDIAIQDCEDSVPSIDAA